VHEFLHAGWQSLYVTELRAELAAIGLRPVGSATLIENFDRWILDRHARVLITEIADPDLRELVRDFCIDQRFRCDVFARDPALLDEGKQRQGLFAAGLAPMRPPAALAYRAITPAGQLVYDNSVARTIVAALATGARSLADMPPTATTKSDLLANALALCAAGDVRPVETGRAPVEMLNRALRRRLGGPEEIPVIALPCGTALELDRELLGVLEGRTSADWREFLALHGLPDTH
jgi:hypothetical protein